MSIDPKKAGSSAASLSRRSVLELGGAALAASAVGPLLTTSASAASATAVSTSGAPAMSTVTTTDGVEIFFKDWGPKDAQPIVFHHGWPLSADDWDNQMLFFLQQRLSRRRP